MLNPPAFPIPDVRTHDGMGISEGSPGMTLRDWFAGQVIPSIVAATATGNHQPNHGSYGSRAEECSLEQLMALDAYRLADAMLAARAGDA